MKIFYTFLFAIMLLSINVFPQMQQYSRILVPATEENISELMQQHIPLEPGINVNESLILELSRRDLNKLQELGISYEVSIENLSTYYAKRNKDASYKIERNTKGDYPVPEGWEFGSMGGMYTYDEALAELDTMQQLYPDLISGLNQIEDYTSIEGRPMNWIKISDNPGLNEDEPEVLYTAVHHAREGIGIQQMIFYMYYLLENYETDSLIHGLVNSTEMYFVPFVNPDGYVYNESTYPYGGGMWRKNRRDNGDGSYGVDLNRNYGYMWGYDNYGSSPYPAEETYRGTESFSEPEAQALKAFCESNEFNIALNYHSYGHYLLYPWGYVSATTDDDNIFSIHAQMMTEENNAVYGPGGVELYRTNGGSDDWMYGEQDSKPAVFAYTPEVGTGSDGFWPTLQRILPLCKQNMHQNIMAARLSGIYAEVKDLSSFAIGEIEGTFSFNVKRLGLSDGGNYTVSIEPLNDAILETGDPVIFSGLNLFQEQEGEISYQLVPSLETGDEITYLLKISDGYITDTDTITKIFGQKEVVFTDDCNTFENWDGIWYITTEDYFSPPASITDSPNGNYSTNMFYVTSLEPEIDLSASIYAELTFHARWDITPDDDWVQVLVSADGGNNWDPLEGKYTRVSQENIIPGQPFYDGYRSEWVKEIIPLDEYLGESLKFRFILRSNGTITADGFYFDDFTVAAVHDDYTDVAEMPTEDKTLKVFPNPAADQVDVYATEKGRLQIFNATGKLVVTRTILNTEKAIQIDLSNWERGMYLYTFTGDNRNISGKLLVH